MRPIRLSMTAFGPYRDTETIDFGLLEDRRLFVISGNTGAGKTSIFDAICFALYGSASGEDRSETRMLRSHFADDEIHTSVDYHFSVGQRTYRVFRQMAHRRGTNKNETGGKAELYETTTGTEVPCVDRFTVSDVNIKMESVIGLTREQFSQIVMLPQGEFRKLLTSDTENKEEILRRIFRTGLYQKLEDRFQRNNRELQDALKQAKATQDVYVKQAQETLPQREDSVLTATLRQEYIGMAQVSEGLEIEIGYYERQAGDIERERASFSDKLNVLETEFREALAMEAKFLQLAEKRRQAAQLDERKAEIKASEELVRLAELATRIEPYEEHALAAIRHSELKRGQLERKRLDVAEAERAHAVAEERYRVEEAREAERKEADLELARLAELMPIVQTLEERRIEADRLAAEERSIFAKREAAERRVEELRQQKRALAERLKTAELEASKLPGKLEQYERMKNKYKLLKELAELDRRLADSAKQEAERERAALALRAEHDRLETSWLEGQAGLLSAHLHDGMPCPVCGSEDHPNKASSGTAGIPSREGLQAAKDKLRAAEQELSEAKAQAAATGVGIAERKALMEEYALTGLPFLEQLAIAEAEGKQLRIETDQLKQQAEKVSEYRQEAEKQDHLIEQLQSERERLLQEQHRITVDRSAKATLLDSELARIPEPLRTPDLLSARIAEQTAFAGRLQIAWQEAQRQLQSSQARLVEERTNAAQAASQLAEGEKLSADSRLKFEEETHRAGFETVEGYRASKLAEAERVERKRIIEQFKSLSATLQQQIADLERELAGRERPVPVVLEEKIAELKSMLERISASLHAALGYKQEAQRLLAALEKTAEQFRELEQKQQQVADIYQMLKGDNPLKISFERYILIEFLEQILNAANARLNDLSNGQFLLQRSDRLETRGKQSGLGLDVFDAYTGQNRDVKSMSGGEKFNASLCLALGMTDVIQAYQGGVSIEMMFIDEGFGSLDEDSLGKAIATLIDLQRAGRMIGVISHVQELKQAFPAVLEVSKTKEGHSRTSFVLK
ncbi:SMC family ATPase [Cohnella endophytica]|uniref:Nuclease SbcCD subunit C n=1 Tax=Cohnella endophytica TaxID=2419778 RepID=A0A494XUA5_9BACL|nr:SMC family ATPase [Cohnella endophytica]RKP54150.1 SMC family ATPase [Cohnella endophytica]